MEILSQQVTLIGIVSWAPKGRKPEFANALTSPSLPPSPRNPAPVLRKHGIRKRKCSVSNSYDDKADKLPDLKQYNLSMAQFWLKLKMIS